MFQPSLTARPFRFFSFFPLHLAFLVIFSTIFVFAQNGYSTEVTLVWDANTDSCTAGYNVHIGTSSMAYNDSFDAEGDTTHTFSGLVDGQTYYFAVTAYDADRDQSDYSTEVEYRCDSESEPEPEPSADLTPIPQSELSVVLVDSEELEGEDGRADNAIDGRLDTFWHTEWYSAAPQHPHDIVIDLGNEYSVAGLQYLPRQDGGVNGTVFSYRIDLSNDGTRWIDSVATGGFARDTTEKEVVFAARTARYIRFVALSEINRNPWTSAAEITILESSY